MIKNADPCSWCKSTSEQIDRLEYQVEELKSALSETVDRLKAMAVLYGESLPEEHMKRYDALIGGEE